MPALPRILLIADPARPDSFKYLIEKSKGRFEWIILWNYKETTKEFLGLPLISWSDFTTPAALLDKVRPDKIIFFEVIDMWQIPLIIHSKKKRVTTFYLAHGMYASVEAVKKRFDERSGKPGILSNFKKVFTSFARIIRTRYFYYAALKDLASLRSICNYILLPVYFKIYTPIQALSKLKFQERTPDKALLFCANNVPYFQLFNELAPDQVLNTGVPFFDKYYGTAYMEGDYIIFIDHPYLEYNILGWDSAFHRKVAEALYSFSQAKKIKLIIKLHPVSNIETWKQYNFSNENVEIIQSAVPDELYLKAKMILGFSSTLLIGFFCAQKNVVLLGWHPEPHIFGVNFYDMGICHVSYDTADLIEKYDTWLSRNLCLQNKNGYEMFLKEFNYPFDGQATERILNAIESV